MGLLVMTTSWPFCFCVPPRTMSGSSLSSQGRDGEFVSGFVYMWRYSTHMHVYGTSISEWERAETETDINILTHKLFLSRFSSWETSTSQSQTQAPAFNSDWYVSWRTQRKGLWLLCGCQYKLQICKVYREESARSENSSSCVLCSHVCM